ncbi:MAG TPA: CBS domain-containing protein [Pseudomonadales bacterium]|nr:CBS domain-containing protein [Pseudomonadales bacterium]
MMLRRLFPCEGFAMATVNHILEKKARGVKTIEASMTVYAAVTLLSTYQIGALVVVEGGRPVGIFSERDYARKGIIRGRKADVTLVRDLMSSPLITVTPGHSIEECMRLMTERRIRHLPVLDEGGLAGIVTIGDVVMHMISRQQSTIEQLEGYITGRF